MRRPNQSFPSLNQGVRSFSKSFLRLSEALITLNEWVRLAKWPLIKLAPPVTKLAQPLIRHHEALNLAESRLTKLDAPFIRHHERRICAAHTLIFAREWPDR
jgi:hypothetical protein